MLLFWILAGVLCVATVAVLMLSTSAKPREAGSRSEGALAIFKDQLAELDREVASGALAESEAEAQRTEISRRLLAASREVETASSAPSRFPKWAVLTVPAVAALIYWQVGNYGFPDVPRAERLAAAETSNDLEALVARVEQHLEADGRDVQGWQLLVPNYLNMGRFGDAANAINNIIKLSGPTAELYASMGEALVFQNNGLMTAQTVAIMAEALKLDPKHPKALYYAALGLAQEGKKAEAKAAFQNLLALSPAEAPWRPTVERELAKLEPIAAAPQISEEQMQGAASMTPEERMAMIRGMVDGLDEKLKANPDDVESWLRLIRARSVLGEVEKASSALATARTTFAAKPDQSKLVEDLAKELNLK